MEIKTIVTYCKGTSDAEKFDAQVNAALAAGWGLVRRELHTFQQHPTDLLYAELFKPGEEEMEELEALPLTWQDAVEKLQETCGTAAACDKTCPMFDWCQLNLPKHGVPANWSDPQ